jgi:putative cell wall-binding protein
VRRTAAGVLAGALALSGALSAGILPANAAAGFGFDRLAGNDRYETSAAIAARYRALAGTGTGTSAPGTPGNPGITNVILASGESGRTPDALAASFLAGVQNAPVVLTRRDNTPEPILAELRNLRTAGATTLTIVGGPAAISEVQVTALRALGFTTINRLGGADRYATARAIVAAGESAAASNVGLVASGVSTIDALAGGPLAYKGKHPLFLVTRDGIPAATLASMRESGVTSVYILGGPAVVGPACRGAARDGRRDRHRSLGRC